MSSRQVVHWLSLGLIVAGLSILAYATYSYIQFTQFESALEAKVPGQDTSNPEPNAVAQAPALTPLGITPVGVTPSPIPPTETPTERPTATAVSTRARVSPTLGNELAIRPDKAGQLRRATATSTAPPTPTPTRTNVPSPTVISVPYPRGFGKNATRIVIPRLGLDAAVREASLQPAPGQSNFDWYIPFDAAGHLFNTANPGEAGNVVLAGHHNLIGPEIYGLGLFAGLWNLRGNDPIYLYDQLGRVFVYRVNQSYSIREADQPLAVRQQHAAMIMADDGTPKLTLITCWNGYYQPLSGNTFRWIIAAPLIGTIDASQVPVVRR